ncbi:alpha/beta fold hydrolase [Modestobacter sp. I12A-02628]|uniref:Alpha/beta hydrolase n=1 Tax=Goekera deserti TaxID=2497753 RepID=A0A7K3WKU0_9ACTN|nr:alpha/beta fold hydrolase [Goekera deserti]MPQ97118.1 alpha/beta fold hydrolase [Goekera deserti]NDI46564.1 alpha/beta fold hydrolase [Goekera deserti]NEL56320.1 alpha/beta hydrolase [Goekera deserti]
MTSQEWALDGHAGRLAARTWPAAGTATHLVLLAHGYGEHVGRYEHVAAALTAAGAVVVGVDHVGHGRSDGERVLVPDVERVVDDLHAVDLRARAEHPGLPVVLLGHSMGGLIAARYAQRYGDGLTALVLSGPLVGDWAAADALLTLPEMPDAPLDITTLSRDPQVGADYAADPLVWHGPFKRPTVQAIRWGLDAVAAGPSLGSLPLLWAHGEADTLVPVEGSRSGVQHLRGERYVERLYPGARHEIFNETNAEEVLADLTGFVADVLAGRLD